MEEIVIETKKFLEQISKASCDSRINGKIKYAITLGMVIQEAFNCLTTTEEDWAYIDPFETLINLSIKHGFKRKMPLYKSDKDLYQAICDFNHENNISGDEKAIYNALSKVSPEYRWRLYLALYDLVDGFLFKE